MNDQRKHSLNALGSGASKPASAAHGFKGPVALELPCEDAPPGTLLTTDPSQDTDDRDTTDGLYDTDSETSECTSTEDSDADRTPCEEGEDVLPQETREKLEKLLDTFEKLYQNTCDQLKKQLVIWRVVPMNMTNSQVEKLIKLLKLVDLSYRQIDGDRQIQHKYRTEYIRKAGKRLVTVGLVQVLCDGVVKCLEHNGNVLKYHSLLDPMLSILWNFTHASPSVRNAIRKHKRLLKALVMKLDDTCTRHNKPSLKAGDDRIDLACVSILLNFGHEEKNVPHLQQIPNIVDVLSRLINLDPCLTVRKFYAILTLASVVTDEEAEKFTTTSDSIKVLLYCVKMALRKDEHQVPIDTTAATLTELLIAIKQLSRNASNSRLLVQQGALPLLIQGLQDCKHQAERKACMESLWWLSFNDDNQEDMMKHTELLDLVISIYRDDSDPCHSAAAGMLFQLREHLHKYDREDYNAVGKRLQKGPETQQAASGHVMLSYQTADREVVQMVCDYLKDNGIPVWMDIYNIADSEKTITQSMAEAVEESVVFLMCLSEGYMRSPFCRQEAEYAFEEKKHIIPLKLHKGFKPRGWLGFIGAGKFFFDLSNKNMYEKKLPDLLKNIRKAFNDADKN